MLTIHRFKFAKYQDLLCDNLGISQHIESLDDTHTNWIGLAEHESCFKCGGPIAGNQLDLHTVSNDDAPIWYINSKQDNDSSNHRTWHLECIGREKAEEVRNAWWEAMQDNGLFIPPDDEQTWRTNNLYGGHGVQLDPYTVAGICKGYNHPCAGCDESLMYRSTKHKYAVFVKTGGKKRFHVRCFGHDRIKHMFLWWNWIATHQVSPDRMKRRSSDGWIQLDGGYWTTNSGRRVKIKDPWMRREIKSKLDQAVIDYKINLADREIERLKGLKAELGGA